MHPWKAAALIVALSASSAAAQQTRAVDLDYRATHASWESSCVEAVVDRHGPSCLLSGLDEVSRMRLVVVAYAKGDAMLSELWLVMPDGLRHEDLPGLLDVELQPSDSDALLTLQGQPLSLGDDRASYLIMAHPDAVEDLILGNARATVTVHLGGGEPLHGRFDLLSGAAAWRAVQMHQGWR